MSAYSSSTVHALFTLTIVVSLPADKFAQTRKRRKSESLSNSQEGRFFRKRRHPSGNMRIGFDITKQESVRTDFK